MNYWKNIKFKSDKETVSNNWSDISIRYHYNFIENAIIQNVDKCNTVLDIGSGFGHWIKFFQDVYKADVEAVEIGLNEYNVLKYTGSIHNIEINKKFDVLNAIGVLHHLINDSQLLEAIDNISSMMHNDSILLIGTRLDFIKPTKEKLRSYRTHNDWVYLLSEFNVQIVRSNAPFHCKKHLDLLTCKLK